MAPAEPKNRGDGSRPLDEERLLTGWRAQAHEIIYEADTPAGRTFDVARVPAEPSAEGRRSDVGASVCPPHLN